MIVRLLSFVLGLSHAANYCTKTNVCNALPESGLTPGWLLRRYINSHLDPLTFHDTIVIPEITVPGYMSNW